MYLGFGLLFTVFLLFSAFVTWYMGGLTGKSAAHFAPVGRALLAAFSLVAALSWAYFLADPGVVSTPVALLTATACVKTGRG